MNKEAFEKLITDIIKDFKTENNIADSVNDDLFNLYARKAVRSILNLTNRIKFPPELKYMVLDIMNDYYSEKSAKSLVINTESNASGSIKEIEEDGRKVIYQDNSDTTINSLISLDIANRLDMRKREIYRYRLLYKEMRYDEQD